MELQISSLLQTLNAVHLMLVHNCVLHFKFYRKLLGAWFVYIRPSCPEEKTESRKQHC